MAPAGIIFDFDGTLAELNIDFGAMRAEVEALARDMGYSGELPGGYLLEAVGTVAKEMPQGFEQAALKAIKAIELRAAARAGLFVYTRPLLARLERQGVLAAVVSRNCADAIRSVMPEVDGLSAFVPRELAARPKPHPDQVYLALAKMGLNPKDAWMVGDHPTDMQAARAAGCKAVGVTTGRTGGGQLTKAGAQMVLEDLSTLAEMLGK